MNLLPLYDLLIVRPLAGDQQVGEIIMPDSATEKPLKGTVIAAGNGKIKNLGKRVPLNVAAGDMVRFGTSSGQKIAVDGQKYFILKEDEVLAVKNSRRKTKPARDVAALASCIDNDRR